MGMDIPSLMGPYTFYNIDPNFTKPYVLQEKNYVFTLGKAHKVGHQQNLHVNLPTFMLKPSYNLFLQRLKVL